MVYYYYYNGTWKVQLQDVHARKIACTIVLHESRSQGTDFEFIATLTTW